MNCAQGLRYLRTLQRSFSWRLFTTSVFLCVVLRGDAQQASGPGELTGTLRIVGTDTMKELLQRWTEAFEAAHPHVTFEVTANGALTAAPALAGDAADLVPLGRELTPAELTLFHKSHGYEPTQIPVALGSYDRSGRTVALAFFVQESNPIARLSLAQLERVYCVAKNGKAPERSITWGDLGVRGGWSALPVHAIGVNFPDGISNFIRLQLCPDRELLPGIRTEHTGGTVNVLERIVDDVSRDPAAIGYAGFANQRPGARLVPVSRDGTHYFSGTRAEVAAGEYPLTRFIYMDSDRKPGQPLSDLQKAFLAFVLSRAGQALVPADGIYMPLPEKILKHDCRDIQQLAGQEEASCGL